MSNREMTGRLSGHTADVAGVSFSPNGHLLASASDDGTVRLWDVVAREPEAVLSGHFAEVNAVAFSPDGRILASASSDQTVRLWDIATKKSVATLSGHSKPVSGVAWSPDGGLLASASGDGSVGLWVIRGELGGAGFSAIPLASLAGHGSEVLAVAFSPDGKLLASASGDKTVRLWRPGDLRFFMETEGTHASYEPLLQRSLYHFGYRLDGFQLVFEPPFGLAPTDAYAFPKPRQFEDLTRARSWDLSLIDWLAGMTGTGKE